MELEAARSRCDDFDGGCPVSSIGLQNRLHGLILEELVMVEFQLMVAGHSCHVSGCVRRVVDAGASPPSENWVDDLRPEF